MTSEESVRRFGEVIGVGKVYGPYGPYESQMGSKPFFMWVCQHKLDIPLAVDALLPYVTPWMRERLLATKALA